MLLEPAVDAKQYVVVRAAALQISDTKIDKKESKIQNL